MYSLWCCLFPNSYIDGGAGNDDIVGGHSYAFGIDTGDELHGGEGEDVILGDNGQIIRMRISEAGTYPWVTGSVWLSYPAPFEVSVVRNVTRYDDLVCLFYRCIVEQHCVYCGAVVYVSNSVCAFCRDQDYVFGDDEIFGGPGNDVLHGQRGDDGRYRMSMSH